MEEKPINNSWILNDSFGTAGSGIGIFWADEISQLRPLKVSCTVCKEDGGKTEREDREC